MTQLALLKADIAVTKSVFLIGVVLFFFFLTFTSVLSYLPKYVVSPASDLQLMQATQYFTIALTLVISSQFSSKIDKSRTLFGSLAAISVAGILLVIISSAVLKLAIIFAMTVMFSLAMLVLFTWFWRMTEPQERGRVTGFMGFVTLPLHFLTTQVFMVDLDFVSTALVGVLLCFVVLLILLLAPREPKAKKKNNNVVYFEKRTVLLYSAPWILFSLVNATLAANVSTSVSAQASSSFYLFLLAFQLGGLVFGALAGGVVADIFGRRPSLALSITLYGISSALVGLFQNNVVFLIAYAINGLGLGILFMLYIFVVWGDLATERNVARMYSIGLAVYYSTLGVGILAPTISQVPLIVTSLASCLLIFFLNVPVILAPELLPSDFREKMRLKLYMKVVRKAGRKPKNQG